MPPNPVPPDVVRVQLVHSLPNDEIVTNTLHLRLSHKEGNPTPWAAMTQTVATKVRDKYLASGAHNQVNPVTRFRRVKAYHLDAATGLAIHEGHAESADPVNGIPGGNTGLVLPFDVACVVSLRTDIPGEVLADPEQGPNPTRRARGRVYIGALSSNFMANNGRFGQGAIDGLADTWAGFLNDVHRMSAENNPGIGDDSWDLVVLSKKAVATRRVTSIVVDDLPDTQRRRSNRMLPQRASRPINDA